MIVCLYQVGEEPRKFFQKADAAVSVMSLYRFGEIGGRILRQIAPTFAALAALAAKIYRNNGTCPILRRRII